MDKKKEELLQEIEKEMDCMDPIDYRIVMMYFSGKSIDDIIKSIYELNLLVIRSCSMAQEKEQQFIEERTKYCNDVIANCQSKLKEKLTNYINENF